jgi:MoaA/NifB/PqqE/SkfB family radical SAM enzyme
MRGCADESRVGHQQEIALDNGGEMAALWGGLLNVAGRAGLSEEDTQHALGRLMGAAQTLAVATGETGGDAQARLLAGVARNVEDDPMLVAWTLRVAARLGDAAWNKFFDNFVVKLVVERPAVHKKLVEELGHPPPVTLVINPTMACNLRCTGCYAFEFGKETMPPELFRRTVEQAREMGVRFLVITGGEPFIYKPLLDVAEEFSDMTFLTYTNGTLIDDKVADRVAALGNIFPALSVEGYEKETDGRRGDGVYASVTAAMERLSKRGVLFGISVTPTSKNSDMLFKDEFIDHYIAKGIGFAWFFNYMPVGRDPDVTLMASPEQRDQLRETTARWHRTKPIFVGDFWNDGASCAGCLSGDRYAFVATDGKVQPCTFVHFYTHNIKDSSLKEIFESPFFKAIRDAQPYHQNLLRPCKIIDHPHILRQLVETCEALPAYAGADALIKDPKFMAFLDEYSQKYGDYADKAWAGPLYQEGHKVLVPFSGLVDLYTRFPARMASAEKNTTHTEATRPVVPGRKSKKKKGEATAAAPAPNTTT